MPIIVAGRNHKAERQCKVVADSMLNACWELAWSRRKWIAAPQEVSGKKSKTPTLLDRGVSVYTIKARPYLPCLVPSPCPFNAVLPAQVSENRVERGNCVNHWSLGYRGTSRAM